MRVDEFLSEHRIPFERISHDPVFTSNDLAQNLHISGKEVAKAVLLRSFKGYFLAVLPASCKVDLGLMSQEVGDEQVAMASEDEMEQLFPDCDRGAIPPFGSLYRLPTLVDEALAADDRIVFEAQCHDQAIRMKFRDFDAMEHPRHGHFTCHN